MSTTNFQRGPDSGQPVENPGSAGQPRRGGTNATEEYRLTFIETSSSVVSLVRQIRELWHAPKVTIPPEYLGGEVNLPVTEMKPWFMDLGHIWDYLRRPLDPIDAYNRKQEIKRALCGGGLALAGLGVGWALKSVAGVILGALVGYVAGRVVGLLIFKKREYPPDMWVDYTQQPTSWANSLLAHGLLIAAMVLPFYIAKMLQPVKAANRNREVTTLISPFIPKVDGPDKRMGGGGGGGDRSPTPASKGVLPHFSKVQYTPPLANIVNPKPKLQMEPTLLGPPALKLPQMAANQPWGDPNGVLGPASNGPGTGGGIGTGRGTGVGPGNGAGFGPGEDAGYGGGPYSVGGSVTEPIPIYRPDPPYSEEARKAKYQGTVVLWIVVDAHGNVTQERVVKPLGLGLDEKALETVKTWKFKPAMSNGTPVPVRVMVEVQFRLF